MSRDAAQPLPGGARLLQIETPRLILRQWRDSDHPAFARLNADPHVMRFFPTPLTESASDAMAWRIRRLIDERGWGLWAVEVKHGPAFIGYVGLHSPAAELPCSPCIEVGWRLDSPHWGQGYASEAAMAALYAAFNWLTIDEIVSFTTVGNLPSRAVMKRIGMSEDPEATFEHPNIAPGHPLRPHCLYRARRDSWSCPDAARFRRLD